MRDEGKTGTMQDTQLFQNFSMFFRWNHHAFVGTVRIGLVFCNFTILQMISLVKCFLSDTSQVNGIAYKRWSLIWLSWNTTSRLFEQVIKELFLVNTHAKHLENIVRCVLRQVWQNRAQFRAFWILLLVETRIRPALLWCWKGLNAGSKWTICVLVFRSCAPVKPVPRFWYNSSVVHSKFFIPWNQTTKLFLRWLVCVFEYTSSNDNMRICLIHRHIGIKLTVTYPSTKISLYFNHSGSREHTYSVVMHVWVSMISQSRNMCVCICVSQRWG